MASKLNGARVLRILQKGPLEGLFFQRFRISEDTGEKASDCIDQEHRRKFAARKDVITCRDLKVNEVLPDPFIKTFVASTNQDPTGTF